MARGVETINIAKASTLTNLFYLFSHGGKAAVMPFLTLFFKLLGLNAIDVGIIIAAKTLTGMIWAPIWSRCATAYNRHRPVMMFSLFLMIATYLSFVALYTQISKPEHCLSIAAVNTSFKGPEYSSTLSSLSTLNYTLSFTSPAHADSTTDGVTTAEPHSSSSALLSTLSVYENQTIFNKTNSLNLTDRDIYFILHDQLNMSSEEIRDLNSTYSLLRANYSTDRDEEQLDLKNVLKQLMRSRHDVEESSRESKKRHKRNEWTDLDLLKEKLYTIRSSLQNDKLLLFLVILAIIVVGEIFSSPVEKLADDSWFDFLNRIDDLERYGQQRFWGSIAFIFVPVIVTVAVDYSPCFITGQLHHFLIHFFLFAVLMFSAWLVSCCYPAPPPANRKHSSKIFKGLHIICCDGRGFLFSVTLLLMGMVYASYYNFLFWKIEDLGGKETVMGLCVTTASFAELPMLVISSHLVKRLGSAWVVSLCMVVLSLRLLSYAFISEPWTFLPVELSHGITHTTMWFAVLTYEDFNSGSSVDRSLRTILSSFYFGVGFSSGSLISGFVYHWYGSRILFWSGSALIGGWCVLFCILQKCLPKKQSVKYVKLLKSESDNSDDEEEDWLEMALKGH
ncbi:hypothetical protein Btru_035890 [Bulinus truncatus]|nr:hypothetical protein Btru_035890 [Bulinus truncatus]